MLKESFASFKKLQKQETRNTVQKQETRNTVQKQETRNTVQKQETRNTVQMLRKNGSGLNQLLFN